MLTAVLTHFDRGGAVTSTVDHFKVFGLASRDGAVFEGISALDGFALEGLTWE